MAPITIDLYERHSADLAALHAASTAVVADLDGRAMCVRIVELLGELLPYRRALVALKDDQGPLEVVAHAAEDRDAMRRECQRITKLIRDHPQTGVIRWVVTHNKAVLLNDAQADRRYLEGKNIMKSELCVPIPGHGEAIGAVNVESPVRGAFSARDECVLCIVANQLGLALENVRLNAELRRIAETRGKPPNAGRV